MGGVKALAFAYRHWAVGALEEVARTVRWATLLVRTAPEDATLAFCEAYKPDVIFFYGWSWMVSDELVARWLCIGLHPSPLPAYRGGSPLQHQIINGETLSAVTLFRMTSEVDAGPICAQVPYSLEGSLDDIFQRIREIAVTETVRLLDTLATGEKLAFREQPLEAQVWRRRKPAESEIKAEEIAGSSARQIHDKIRALWSEDEDYPPASISCGEGERLYLSGSYLEVPAKVGVPCSSHPSRSS